MDRNLLEMMSVQQSIAWVVGTGAWGWELGGLGCGSLQECEGKGFFCRKIRAEP